MMKFAVCALSVTALVGAAHAAPFNARGATFGGTDIQTGLFFSSGSVVRSPNTFTYGKGAVANPDNDTWQMLAVGNGTVNTTTWFGLYPGEVPDWTTVLESPGGDTIGSGGLVVENNAAVFDFGWARLELGPVTSAPANIIGAGEYVWFGQMVGTDPSAQPQGDVNIIFTGGPVRAVLNSSPATDPVTGQSIFLISVESAPGIHQLYLTNVPAPGAFALLGLGGLAGTRRHR